MYWFFFHSGLTADLADPDAAESTDIIQPAGGPTSPASPLEAFEKFKKEVLDENQPRQLFSVTRMEGSEALKGDILFTTKIEERSLGPDPELGLRMKKVWVVAL